MPDSPRGVAALLLLSPVSLVGFWDPWVSLRVPGGQLQA